MTMTARDKLIALMMVGRNLEEIQTFGRILNAGERKKVADAERDFDAAYPIGMEAATNGAKLKTNPHPGGSPAWWGWNEGYKASKKIEADHARHGVKL